MPKDNETEWFIMSINFQLINKKRDLFMSNKFNRNNHQQELVVVLGMHRSGTSVVTRGLMVAGISLGDNLMPPAAGNNDKGFWEDIDLVDLNERLLKAIGYAWDSVRSLQAEQVAFLSQQGYLIEAVRLLNEKLNQYKKFGFKDPRVAKLLPFWQRVFEAGDFAPRYVVALRNPISVADSLYKRNGFPKEKSYLLWIEHVLTILKCIVGKDYIFIDYDRVLENTDEFLKDITEFLGTEVIEEDSEKFKHDFLTDELRHSKYKPKDIFADYAAIMLTKEVYGALVEVVDKKSSIEAVIHPDRLNQWEIEFDRMRPALNLIDSLSQAISERDSQIASLTNETVRLNQTVTDRETQIASLSQAISERDSGLAKAKEEAERMRSYLASVFESRSWRVTKPIRKSIALLRQTKGLFASGPHGKTQRYLAAKTLYHRLPVPPRVKHKLRNLGKRILSPETLQDYQTWIKRYDALTDTDRKVIGQQIASWENPPKISVIMPCYNPPEKFLRLAIESVRKQLYPHWELCIADDASPQPHVRRVLEEYARRDQRIKVLFREKNGHISATSNSALSLASGEYIALLDHDDALAEHALYWVAAEIMQHPEAELIYSDEDKIDKNDRRCDPFFKPDWNPELLLGQNYISHLGVYKRDRVLQIGAFREGFEGSQDWDLVLRFTEGLPVEKIRHIPAVLYHWRMLANSTASNLAAKPYVVNAASKAIAEALHRKKENFLLDSACDGAFHLPRFEVQECSLVSIIIPTRNGLSDLRQCLDSLAKTEYPHYEILVINNQSDDPDTLAFFNDISKKPGCRVVSYDQPFDYAAMHNWAVPQARGDYLCLLNNDTEVVTPHWLGEMLGQAQRDGIGAVGAKLLYPDGTVQHGGVVLGVGGIAGHAHKGKAGEFSGYFSRASLVQNFSAVTAACMLLRKKDWEIVGGMSAELSVAYNDVDLCLKLLEMGRRNVWLPHAVLYHHESKSRGSDLQPHKLRRFAMEHAYMQWRWGAALRTDPAYNPNLTLDREDFSMAWPPRVQRPWHREPIVIDVPYGLPHMEAKPLTLMPGGELQGSFPLPVGVRGTLHGMGIMIGNYGGASNGTLTLRIEDDTGQIVHAHTPLSGSQDNAMLPMIFTRGHLILQGQERLTFRVKLEGASHPVALWTYPLNERWGHQISGYEEMAIRMDLRAMTDSL
ncbi:glycosyltransferase [Candidatus Igneacidithiobacillus taiwanensis]|uniref:glycosyltransferase n=2 Tax=Candidatus Igneacidithiobacillus taiwanensis TaxID=1945924 RepID=UPI0028A0BF25|nr:glycosyltransferase [Candidatus Igneacidithiobacillus taiwanensis]